MDGSKMIACSGAALAVAALLFGLLSAPENVIDGRTQHAFAVSVQHMEQELEPEDRTAFRAALGRHACDVLGVTPVEGESLPDPTAWSESQESLARKLRSRLAGLDVQGVLSSAPAFVIPRAGNGDSIAAATRRGNANEDAARQTLRLLVDAQLQVRRNVGIDRDLDGRGEFGFFGELAGKEAIPGIPGEEGPLDPAVLPAELGAVRRGVLTSQGYHFKLYLADARGGFVAEGGRPDPVRSAELWCCYAWPERDGDTGTRVFFINQEGVLLSTDNGSHAYSGMTRKPDPTAGFISSSANLDTPIALDEVGASGDAWQLDRLPAAPR